MKSNSNKKINILIPISTLIGIIAILIVSIYNNAFKKGYFTCQKYILNTYLYILLTIIIVTLEVLLFDYNNVTLQDIYGKYLSWPMIIVKLVIILALLWFLMSINPRNVILKHTVWLLFALAIGVTVYPSYLLSKSENTIMSVLFTLISILVFFSLVAFIRPDWISLSWGPVLMFMLIGVIIAFIIHLIMNKGKKRIPKGFSFFIIGLFILFIMYDTKLIQVQAKICKENSVDYINQSLGIFIDAINIFQSLVNVYS